MQQQPITPHALTTKISNIIINDNIPYYILKIHKCEKNLC